MRTQRNVHPLVEYAYYIPQAVLGGMELRRRLAGKPRRKRRSKSATPPIANPVALSKRGKRAISRKISQLVREGYPHTQAVAIAYNEMRAGKLPNPAPHEWDDEWDAELEQAAKEGDKWLREEIGRGRIKPWRVSWYAPLAQRTVYLPHPVKAHTQSEAIKVAKAMVGANDKRVPRKQKPVNFIAEQMPMEHLGSAINPKDVAAKFIQLGGKLERALQAKNFDKAIQIEKEIEELATTEDAAEIYYPFLVVRGRNVVRKARKMTELHNPSRKRSLSQKTKAYIETHDDGSKEHALWMIKDRIEEGAHAGYWTMQARKRGALEVEIAEATEVGATMREHYKNPQSAYSVAASRGFPYIRGEGRVANNGYTWLSRFENRDGSRAIYVGYDDRNKKWIIEYEAKNPADYQQLVLIRVEHERPSGKGWAVYDKWENKDGLPEHKLAEAAALADSLHDRFGYQTRVFFKREGKSGSTIYRNPSFHVDATPTLRAVHTTITALTHGSAARKIKKQLGKHKGAYKVKVEKLNPNIVPPFSTTEQARKYVQQYVKDNNIKAGKWVDAYSIGRGLLLVRFTKKKYTVTVNGDINEYATKQERNPGAPAHINDLAQMFHGRVTGAELNIPVSYHHKHNKHIQRIGRLPYIKMHNRPQGQQHASPKHACNECAIFFPRRTSWVSMNNGKRIILGGKGVHNVGQRLYKMATTENPRINGGEVNLGRIEVLAYITPEKHSNSGQPILYYHPHAENTGRVRDMPSLHIDSNGMLYIPERSGNYDIDERGIIN